MGPWGCTLLDGSYSLQDYIVHHFPLNQSAQEGLGFQEHPAGQQDLGVPSFHSLGDLERLEIEEIECYECGTITAMVLIVKEKNKPKDGTFKGII